MDPVPTQDAIAIRLECLRLAVTELNEPEGDIVRAASIFANFVLTGAAPSQEAEA